MSPLLLEAAAAWRECRLTFSEGSYWLKSLSQGDHAQGEPAEVYTQAIRSFFGTDHKAFSAWAVSASANSPLPETRPSARTLQESGLIQVELQN